MTDISFGPNTTRDMTAVLPQFDVLNPQFLPKATGGTYYNSAGDQLLVKGIYWTGFEASGVPEDGIVTGFSIYVSGYASGGSVYNVNGVAVPVADFFGWVRTVTWDKIVDNLMQGGDTLIGLSGADTLRGGAGYDIISGGNGSNYLRGDADGDYITGGAGFDDINGNMGNDTVYGGQGSDWVVGGKDDDYLHGDGGDDLIYGNMGADLCYGGAGADTIRGGQDDDTLSGDDGDDWLFGDRGNDQLWGGGGADIFTLFDGAGVDRVLGFDFAEGDRVRIEGGAAYSIEQRGGDTVIRIGADAQMVLVGERAASLPPGWIFSA